jgi:hypothetical protein
MSSSLTLAQVLDRPDVWRGDTLARTPLPGVPTGFAELDRELPGGGWPRGGLTEILPLRRGIGELSLLLPALARLSSDELAWLVCVASPHPLHAPALHESGIDLSRLLVASAPGRDSCLGLRTLTRDRWCWRSGRLATGSSEQHPASAAACCRE